MANMTPAYPTLMELRAAGWTLAEISRTYGVDEQAIRSAIARHFVRGSVAGRLPPQVGPVPLQTTFRLGEGNHVVHSSKVSWDTSSWSSNRPSGSFQ